MSRWCFLCLLLGCTSEPASKENPVIAGQDLERLKKMSVPLPTGIENAHWLLRRKGQPSSAPGPTDTELLVWIPLDATRWSTLRETLGQPRPGARAELHPAFLEATRPDDIGRVIMGEGLDPAPLSRGPWQANWALWTGKHLVIDFHSR